MKPTSIHINIMLLLLFTSFTIKAQTHYYNETKTFYENGFAYQCDVDESALVVLYNKESKHTYDHLEFKDGTDANGAIIFHGMRPLKTDNWTYDKIIEIADKHFSDLERGRVADRVYNLKMIIDSSSGKVIEVSFSFHKASSFATIPISTYRMIELDLKENVWFIPSEDGKRMKFILSGHTHEVSRFKPISW